VVQALRGGSHSEAFGDLANLWTHLTSLPQGLQVLDKFVYEADWDDISRGLFVEKTGAGLDDPLSHTQYGHAIQRLLLMLDAYIHREAYRLEMGPEVVDLNRLNDAIRKNWFYVLDSDMPSARRSEAA
jgi:hypothetical protein